MSKTRVAIIAGAMFALTAPAFAEDANIAAVLRDVEQNPPRSAELSDTNALAFRPANIRSPQHGARVTAEPQTALDFSRAGHN